MACFFSACFKKTIFPRHGVVRHAVKRNATIKIRHGGQAVSKARRKEHDKKGKGSKPGTVTFL